MGYAGIDLMVFKFSELEIRQQWGDSSRPLKGTDLLAPTSITVANAVIAVPENNSVAMADVDVPQVISSATAHALTRTSMTTTVANAEMSVLQTQVVVQELAFLTLRLTATTDMHRQRRKSALMSPSHAKMIYCHRAYT